MSEEIRWGILGTARIAEKLAKAIHGAKNARLAVVGSRDAVRAAAWAEAHGADRSAGSYEAVLEAPDVDAVYVPLPPSLHAEWTLRAAAAGKHVLCEKPLATSTADAVRMAEACRAAGVQLMDGVMWLHHPRERDMREVLEANGLGSIRSIASAFTFCWPEIPESDFRTQRGYGGGCLLDLGWYCVGAALWAMRAMPVRVFGAARYRRDVDMHFNGLMWFEDGITASLDCGFDTVMRRWLEIAGSDCALLCDDFTRPWHADRPQFRLHSSDGSDEQRQSAGPIQEVCMVEAFCSSVLTGELRDDWVWRGLATQRVCESLAVKVVLRGSGTQA